MPADQFFSYTSSITTRFLKSSKNEKSGTIKSRFDARGKWHHKGYWVVTGQSSLLGIWSSWPDLFCRSKAKRSSIIKKLDVQIFFLSISWLKLPCFGIWRRFYMGRKKQLLYNETRKKSQCLFSTLEMKKTRSSLWGYKHYKTYSAYSITFFLGLPPS